MGQGHSSANKLTFEQEMEFLVKNTSLTSAEVVELNDKYSGKKTLTKREFLTEFKRTFPK